MKLSNRKQLLSEADITLKSLLTEAPGVLLRQGPEIRNMGQIARNIEDSRKDAIQKVDANSAVELSNEMTKALSEVLVGKKLGGKTPYSGSPVKSVRAVAQKNFGFSDRSSQKISEFLPLSSMDVSVTIKFENGKTKKFTYIDDVIRLFFRNQ